MTGQQRTAGLAAAAGLLALAGCGTATATASASASDTAPASASLRVGLLEWQIATSGSAVTAGVDHLTVTNTGTTAHDLHVTGVGVHAHTPLLAPGATATLTITTRAGTALTLTCEVPGHEEAGMHTTLRVVT